MVVWKTVLTLKLLKIIKIFAIFFIANQAYITSANASNAWQGIVTHVTDGDTLRVRPIGSNGKADSVRIRIDGIDAPESCQPYGAQSTAALKKRIIAKQVTINDLDVGGWMVKNGHAWSYHYRYSAGPYRVEEEAAARTKLGLFADTSAIEPRIFRRGHGSCYLAPKNDHKRYK